MHWVDEKLLQTFIRALDEGTLILEHRCKWEDKLKMDFKAVQTLCFLGVIFLFTNTVYCLSKPTIIRLLPRHVSACMCHLQGVYWVLSPLKTSEVHGLLKYTSWGWHGTAETCLSGNSAFYWQVKVYCQNGSSRNKMCTFLSWLRTRVQWLERNKCSVSINGGLFIDQILKECVLNAVRSSSAILYPLLGFLFTHCSYYN
jgi:hypothetical protein